MTDRLVAVPITIADARGLVAQWHRTHETRAERWDRPARPRRDDHPAQAKLRWEVSA